MRNKRQKLFWGLIILIAVILGSTLDIDIDF
jgi:hypothetical protein